MGYHTRIQVGSSTPLDIAVNIYGNGAPTEQTEALRGMVYMDAASEDGDLYKCIRIENKDDGSRIFIWKPVLKNMVVKTIETPNGLESDRPASEIIDHVRAGGNVILEHMELGYLQFLWSDGTAVMFGVTAVQDDGALVAVTAVIANTDITVGISLINPAEYARADETYDRETIEAAFQAVSEEMQNRYTRAEIDDIMGSYINDIDALIGG